MYMCVCMCIYIYIYMYVCVYTVRVRILGLTRASGVKASAGSAQGAIILFQSSGQNITHQNHKSEIPLENATENPSANSSKIHWTSDNPLENTAR